MLCSFQAEGKNDTTEGVDVRGRYGNFCQANKGGHACVGRPPHFFGEASGLKTKFQKSTIIPIRCEGLNLNNILAGSPTEVLCFPIKYLGLLLTVKCLKRVDFQPLVDKAINKLTLWNGCQINPAGRLTLVKAVLTS
jgi:hypothetical protein